MKFGIWKGPKDCGNGDARIITSLFLEDDDQMRDLSRAKPPFYAGLAIGQPDTHTALVIVEHFRQSATCSVLRKMLRRAGGDCSGCSRGERRTQTGIWDRSSSGDSETRRPASVGP